MKFLIFMSMALAGDSPKEQKEPAESGVEKAVQMNEQLSEILARVEKIKTETELAQLVESTPVKRVEPEETNP